MAGVRGMSPVPLYASLGAPAQENGWSAIGRRFLNDRSSTRRLVDGETGGPRSDEEDEFFRSGG